MRSRLIFAVVLLVAAIATIAAGPAAPPARAAVVRVTCDGCQDWPVWLQAVVTLVGVGLAMAVLYIPYRLSRNARTPQRGSQILVGGILIAVIGLIVGARLLVVLFPG